MRFFLGRNERRGGETVKILSLRRLYGAHFWARISSLWGVDRDLIRPIPCAGRELPIACEPPMSAGETAVGTTRGIWPEPTEPGLKFDGNRAWWQESAQDEENVPAQPNPKKTGSRLPSPDEDEKRSSDPQAATSEGSQATHRIGGHQIAVSETTGRFRRSDRLRRSADFKRVARIGRRIASRNFVFVLGPPAQAISGNTPGTSRLGVTVSRRVGNAVVRNRVKRAIREWYRQGDNGLGATAPCDLVVIARAGARDLKATAIRDELAYLAERDRTKR